MATDAKTPEVEIPVIEPEVLDAEGATVPEAEPEMRSLWDDMKDGGNWLFDNTIGRLQEQSAEWKLDEVAPETGPATVDMAEVGPDEEQGWGEWVYEGTIGNVEDAYDAVVQWKDDQVAAFEADAQGWALDKVNDVAPALAAGALTYIVTGDKTDAGLVAGATLIATEVMEDQGILGEQGGLSGIFNALTGGDGLAGLGRNIGALIGGVFAALGTFFSGLFDGFNGGTLQGDGSVAGPLANRLGTGIHDIPPYFAVPHPDAAGGDTGPSVDADRSPTAAPPPRVG